MLVKLLNFGTNWWARFGSEAPDPHCHARHAAYHNSTGIRCGQKIRRHWIVPGLIRFNGVGEFNSHRPKGSRGHTFSTSNRDCLFGGNRLLFKRKMPEWSVADWYLVVISQDLHGRVNLGSPGWRSPVARVIAASQLRQTQEIMLLMKPGNWVQTAYGFWQLSVSNKPKPKVELVFLGQTPF